MQKALEEEKLVLARITRGDTHAFGLLFNFYRNKVYGYALAILHTESAAEEIVQDIFIKLWIKRERLDTVENFGAYLRILVRNETLNALKQLATTRRLYDLASENQSELSLDTENSIQFRETNRLLENAIQKLPPQQKIIYTLCKIDGLKQKEVAEKLNISPLTVKSHLQEAVKSVRNYFIKHNQIKILPLIIFFLK